MTEMTQVESSNVSAVGHDGANLLVEFHSGARYRYFDVPLDEKENLIQASSVGRYLNRNIKPNFEYERLT